MGCQRFRTSFKTSKVAEHYFLIRKRLGIVDLEIEVEYQSETIGKYDLDFDGHDFALVPKQTTCLAQDACGIPKQKLQLAELGISKQSCCAPGGGCC